MKKKGFTLIEVVVVMAIIAVLALLVIGAIVAARRTAVETTNRSNAKTLQTGLEAYFAKNRQYPKSSGSESFKVAAGTTLGTDYITADSTPSLTGTNPSCQGKLVSSIAVDGGGYITYNSNGYVLSPVNWNCNEVMLADKITYP